MNYNQNRYDADRDSYNTNRPERYRQPEQGTERNTFDNYRSEGRGNVSYGNDFYRSSQRRSPQDWNPEHIANRGMSTYDTARNYGNMGSYGGAQGFGSERGGYPHHRTTDIGSEFESGMGEQHYGNQNQGRRSDQNRRYGYQSDYDSHGQNSDNYRYERSNEGLYDDYASRRYRDTGHRGAGYERDSYTTHSFGGDRGNYMGSGYERTARNTEYGATQGDYGKAGQYMGRFSSSTYDEPYGMSGYYRGGYNDTDYNSYARDRDERSNDW